MLQTSAHPVNGRRTEVHAPPAEPRWLSGIRLLCVDVQQRSSINLVLQLDAAGCIDPEIQWVTSAADALFALREESFDCVIVGRLSEQAEPRESLELLQSIRMGGCDDPLVVLVSGAADLLWGEFAEHEVELLTAPARWESRSLLPVIQRAMRRVQVLRDNQRFLAAERQRLMRDRDEAEHLLLQQRQILNELEQLASGTGLSPQRPDPLANFATASPCSARPQLPPELGAYYQELLRNYVIMGTGSLAGEISKLSNMLADAEVTPSHALELHLEHVERLVLGLGNRSTRHVMARADLLALELVMRLGECYQARSSHRRRVTP